MASTSDERGTDRDRRYELGARLIGRGAVWLGAIGVVTWPVSLLVVLATRGGGDRLLRAVLNDPRRRPWLFALYAGGWLWSIVLALSGTAFLRGSNAGRRGLIGCALALAAVSVAGTAFNLTQMPAILASLPPPVPAWQRLYTDWTMNLASLFLALAVAGSAIWLLTRPAVVERSGRS